ncbi:MAG: ABC transporter permease [Chitinophagaceae bacterium]|nr:MAG: ABC transporter permease [Chitinophagaceae bacterium]
MFNYILKRILIFIPTLFIISLITFALSKMAPGDPIEQMLSAGSEEGLTDRMAGERQYIELTRRFGYDLPNFYFSLTSAAYPDTLYRVYRTHERSTLSRLIDKHGNWEEIQEYYNSIRTLEFALFNVPRVAENFEGIRTIRDQVNRLYRTYDDRRINNSINLILQVQATQPAFGAIESEVLALSENYKNVVENQTHYKKYIPSISFYGVNNQYHRWLFGDKSWLYSLTFRDDSALDFRSKGFFRGDFGISFQDRRPVSSVMFEAIKWTFILNFVSIIIAYIISIPIGVLTAVKKDTAFDRGATAILFILYSLPGFWVATLLVIYFTTNDYGTWTNLFPTHGLGSLPDTAPFFDRFRETAYHLILPIFCITYASFAFISRQMRGGMLGVIRQDFIRTAKAKGLDDKTIIWKHALRNSLIPIITMFASLFPLAISGSVVIETIFSIPGMGQISFLAVLSRNYPIVFTVLMFSAVLTLIGNLVADILYAIVDPRISFTKKG